MVFLFFFVTGLWGANVRFYTASRASIPLDFSFTFHHYASTWYGRNLLRKIIEAGALRIL